MNKLLEKLELLFDEYYAEQLKLSDTPNADYYLFMGKTSGIGEATDLLKTNIRDIMLEFGTFLTENEEVPDLIYKGKKIDFLLDKFIEETDQQLFLITFGGLAMLPNRERELKK